LTRGQLREIIKKILEEVKERPGGDGPSHLSPYVKFVVHSSNFIDCADVEEQEEPV
jgi:hypothetical protein